VEKERMDYLLIPLDIVALIAGLGTGYYSIRMIFFMRHGKMENAWKYFTCGSIVLVASSIFFSLSDVSHFRSWNYLFWDDLGTALTAVGFVIILLGFRSLYRAWALKDLEKQREREAKNAISK
jgi:O-antigen/teichoic acid export membrane protein